MPEPPTAERTPGSRARLVSAASLLLSRQGYAPTGVKEIAREGGAPIGSFYFHFPGGKEELGVAALRHGAERFGAWLRETLQQAEPVEEALGGCMLALADELQRSDWLDGCPVAATALEAVPRSPALCAAAAEAFEGWQAIIAERLRAGGIAAPAARELAAVTLSLLEGAELLARVQASPAPLEHAAAAVRTLAGAHVRGPA